VLSAITITAQPSLSVGTSAQLSATGTAVGGDNQPTLLVPIADPASHVWTSSNLRVAIVDTRTGTITARHPGSAVISVTSGGITATTTLTVI
ncbi:MAG TPA: Ig-like domain-containing protein, partial [Pseudonocardiaceae bacterium]|nr:Ig-like domain-containing protein [Pseudonocardiaceae bacterium]